MRWAESSEYLKSPHQIKVQTTNLNRHDVSILISDSIRWNIPDV